MTVHGAKGLEAPVVFLVDTTTSPSDTQRLKLINLSQGNGDPHAPGVVVWAGRKAEDPPPVVAARAAMIGDTEDEYRRLLYVAMTRAADRLIVEVYGTGGYIEADLFRGNSALTYSEKGYGYALEKASTTQGWTFTMFEEAFNQGYPQELRHFVQAVREDTTPLVTGEDGRAVLEMLYAAYASARSGQKVALPFRPKVAKPLDLWRG